MGAVGAAGSLGAMVGGNRKLTITFILLVANSPLGHETAGKQSR